MDTGEGVLLASGGWRGAGKRPAGHRTAPGHRGLTGPGRQCGEALL